MTSQSTNTPDQEDEQYHFRNAFNDRKKDLYFLWNHKFKIAAACIVGGVIGILVTFFWPVTYTARTTFVVEEGKSGGGGLLSSLAGQMGFDIGGLMGGTGGVLAGDNVQQLLISQMILKKAILTPVDSGSNQTLADSYADLYKLKDGWLDKSSGKPINFPPNAKTYTRLQDSLLMIVLSMISEKQVGVSKPDKKLSFFALTVTMKDEVLASKFANALIDVASDFYIQTKTKRLRTNVNKLQHRADSIGSVLNRKTYSSSAATSPLLDLNPAYVTAGVPSELQERDKRVLQTIYAEIVKNLEVSRTMLMQETPTFQLVDTPDLPLKKNKLRKSSAGMAGIAAAGVLMVAFLFIRRLRS